MRKSFLYSFAVFLVLSCPVFGQQNKIHTNIHSNSTNANQNKTENSANIAPTPVEQLSIEQQKAPESNETAQQQQETQPTEINWTKWAAIGTLASAVASLIVVFFIYLQARISYRQLKAMCKGLSQGERTINASQRQARSAEKMFKMSEAFFYESERAYIGVLLELSDDIVQDKPLEYRCIIMNKGKTPAWDIEPKIGVALDDPDVDSTPRFRLPQNSKKGEILPGTETVAIGRLPKLEPKHFSEIMEGTTKMFVVGEIKYKCIQGRKETCYFQFVLDPNKKIFFQCAP